MKIFIILLFVASLIALWIAGNSEWHLNRNKHNQPPEGNLSHKEGNFFVDKAGRQWELQPPIKNKFHQPDEIGPPVENPYSTVTGTLKYDPQNPNLKFLCATESGESHEAILQPNGKILETGPKKGTYNYGHPDGIWGSLKHVVLDVLPHFVNGNYK